MKISFLFLALGLFATSAVLSQSIPKGDSLTKMIAATWEPKKITINGKENPENRPTQDDVMVLNADYTFVVTDHAYDYDQKGTWAVVDNNMIVLIDSEQKDKAYLKIVRLTNEDLVLRPEGEGYGEMLITFSKRK